MFFRVFGDVIEFDRQVVGKLKRNISASLKDNVVEALHEYEPKEEVDEEDKAEASADFEALKDKIFEQCEAKAEAGMVELCDLEAILEAVKFDEGNT